MGGEILATTHHDKQSVVSSPFTEYNVCILTRIPLEFIAIIAIAIIM